MLPLTTRLFFPGIFSFFHHFSILKSHPSTCIINRKWFWKYTWIIYGLGTLIQGLLTAGTAIALATSVHSVLILTKFIQHSPLGWFLGEDIGNSIYMEHQPARAPGSQVSTEWCGAWGEVFLGRGRAERGQKRGGTDMGKGGAGRGLLHRTPSPVLGLIVWNRAPQVWASNFVHQEVLLSRLGLYWD